MLARPRPHRRALIALRTCIRTRTRAARRPARPRRPAHHLGIVAAVGVLAAGLATGAGGEPDPRVATAAVSPASGFAATVAGWTSWYGAYGLADLGWAWCIDHGSAAPDPDLVYTATSIDAESGADTRAAMGWAVTANPPLDATTAAAIMLALHDLRGATYPFGRLDLDHLGPGDLAGFEGAEAAVLDRARAIKGDALAHAHLRQPFTLAVTTDRPDPGGDGALRATLTDANGAPVAGLPIVVWTAGATLTSGPVSTTGGDGQAWFGFRAAAGENRFEAHADLPRTEPSVFAPTVAPAQRVIVPAWTVADGADAFTPPTTTTTTSSPTTTAAPTTTTTVPAPTTTRAPTTTTTRPPSTTTPAPTTTTSTSTSTTAPTTTVAPTTTTSTTTTPSTTSTTTTSPTTDVPPTPPTTSATPSRSTATTLPRTGRPVTSWVLIGAGLVLLGAALTTTARRRTTPS